MMKKRRFLGIVLAAAIVFGFSSCSLGQTVHLLLFGTEYSITSVDGAVLSEPDFIDYEVPRVLYSELMPLQQQAYRIIYNSVFQHKTKILIPKLDQVRLTEVMVALRGDNPHMLCLDKNYTYYSAFNGCYIMPDYTCDAETCAERTALLINKAKKIVASIPAGADDFVKELFLHNELCALCVYGEGDFADNAYGSLINGRALCEGYTMGFKLLLDMAGVTSAAIRGSAVNSLGEEEPHIWSAVKLGSGWYFTDVTWDDPVSQNEYGSLRHSYFNVTEKEISADHLGYDLPAGMLVRGGEFDYFRRTGRWLEEADWYGIILDGVKNAVEAGGAHLEFKFASSELLESSLDRLFTDGEIHDMIRSCSSADGIRCSYSSEDGMKVLHIYIGLK